MVTIEINLTTIDFFNWVWLVLIKLPFYVLKTQVGGLLSVTCIVSFSWNVSIIAVCVEDIVLYGTNKYIGLWTWHMVRTATTTSYIKY